MGKNIKIDTIDALEIVTTIHIVLTTMLNAILTTMFLPFYLTQHSLRPKSILKILQEKILLSKGEH